jgi:hypothetical protein
MRCQRLTGDQLRPPMLRRPMRLREEARQAESNHLRQTLARTILRWP